MHTEPPSKNLQLNHNVDGTVTVYLDHHKQLRGTPRQVNSFVKRYYGKWQPKLRKETFTVDKTRQ